MDMSKEIIHIADVLITLFDLKCFITRYKIPYHTNVRFKSLSWCINAMLELYYMISVNL